jgi:hypothetical protein
VLDDAQCVSHEVFEQRDRRFVPQTRVEHGRHDVLALDDHGPMLVALS